MPNVECRSEQSFGHARIFGDVRRFEQARYDRNAARAGGDHLLEVIDLDSADAKDRESYIEMRLFDIFESDRSITGFGRRSENRTESNIVRAFALRCASLAKAVR